MAANVKKGHTAFEVSIPTAHKAALAKIKKQKGISYAELIRLAVELLLAKFKL